MNQWNTALGSSTSFFNQWGFDSTVICCHLLRSKVYHRKNIDSYQLFLALCTIHWVKMNIFKDKPIQIELWWAVDSTSTRVKHIKHLHCVEECIGATLAPNRSTEYYQDIGQYNRCTSRPNTIGLTKQKARCVTPPSHRHDLNTFKIAPGQFIDRRVKM